MVFSDFHTYKILSDDDLEAKQSKATVELVKGRKAKVRGQAFDSFQSFKNISQDLA